MRRRVEVSESADEAHGGFNIGPTKTYSHRSVGIPRRSRSPAPYLASKKQTDLVFEGPDGGPLRHSNWYPRHFKPARHQSRSPQPHQIPRPAPHVRAFLIAEGAHPRAIMERMGHSTINVTLGTYGHLFPAIDEQLDDALATSIRSSDIRTVEHCVAPAVLGNQFRSSATEQAGSFDGVVLPRCGVDHAGNVN